MDSSSDTSVKKRVRRWHHRGFSGCSTCKKRHVKCDETAPDCLNCTKRGLECDRSHRNATFKAYTQTGQEQSKKSQGTNSARNSCSPSESRRNSINSKKGFDVTSNPSISPEITPNFDPEVRYYSYFVETVSTMLIIYDVPHHSNPFTYIFPRYAHTSMTLYQAMSAIGALHLGNTTSGRESSVHLHHAMKTYGDIMQSLRKTWSESNRQFYLTDLATCLLLCIFEMLDSQVENWKVHLSGARDIYESVMNAPTPESSNQRQFDILEQPFRRFLVSLMEYLSVTGAVSTNAEMSIGGPYWEMRGGGRQHNPNVSAVAPERIADDIFLGDLRHAWSVLAGIKTDISTLGDAILHGMPAEKQDAMFRDLEDRLASWKALAPDSFSLFARSEIVADGLENSILLESMACVKAHEQATIIYLHQLARNKERTRQPSPSHIRMVVCQVLALAKRFVKGVGRLAMLWVMYRVGLEVTDENDRMFMREWYRETAAYGFKTAEQALSSLENVWGSNPSPKTHGWIGTSMLNSSHLLQ